MFCEFITCAFAGRDHDRPKSGFYSAFPAKIDVKKTISAVPSPVYGLADVGPDLGPKNAFIPK